MARWVDLDECILITVGEMNFYPEELLGEIHDDVAPVVHAHWVEFENPNYSPFDNSPEKIVLCSHCNNGHGTKDDYCCVCGAIMDEEVKS